MFTRRHTLMAFAMLPVACNSTPGSNTPVQIVQDISNMVTALSNSFAALSPNLIPRATAEQIDFMLGAARDALAGVSAVMSADSAAPKIRQVEDIINEVIAIAAGLPVIPAPFSTALAAASIVLPIVEAWLNATLKVSVAPPQRVAFARDKLQATVPAMTRDQAEAVLVKLARR